MITIFFKSYYSDYCYYYNTIFLSFCINDNNLNIETNKLITEVVRRFLKVCYDRFLFC